MQNLETIVARLIAQSEHHDGLATVPAYLLEQLHNEVFPEAAYYEYTEKPMTADDFRTIEAQRVADLDGFHEAMMERPLTCPYDDMNDVRREAWIAGYQRGIQLIYNSKEND